MDSHAPARATENGLSHYPTGVNTAVPALVPPEGGTVCLNHNQWHTANTFNGPNGKSAVPGFQLNVIAEAPRFLHTWLNVEGVDLAPRSLPQLTWIDIHTGSAHSSRVGFGDLNFVPVHASYQYKALFPNIGLPRGATARAIP